MQLLNWFAIDKESNKIDEMSYEFSDINKDNLLYFGMEGEGVKFKHNIKTGQVKVNENNMLFGLDNVLIGRSKEVINFKERLNVLGEQNQIVGYYTGWKESSKDFDYIEILIWVDMIENKIKLRLRLTPKIESCDFNIIMNGEVNTIELKFEQLNARQEFVFDLSN
jgi:hypothetical protein